MGGCDCIEVLCLLMQAWKPLKVPHILFVGFHLYWVLQATTSDSALYVLSSFSLLLNGEVIL